MILVQPILLILKLDSVHSDWSWAVTFSPYWILCRYCALFFVVLLVELVILIDVTLSPYQVANEAPRRVEGAGLCRWVGMAQQKEAGLILSMTTGLCFWFLGPVCLLSLLWDGVATFPPWCAFLPTWVSPLIFWIVLPCDIEYKKNLRDAWLASFLAFLVPLVQTGLLAAWWELRFLRLF